MELSWGVIIKIKVPTITICTRVRMVQGVWVIPRRLNRQFRMIYCRQTHQTSAATAVQIITIFKIKIHMAMEVTAAMGQYTRCCPQVFFTHNFTQLQINLMASIHTHSSRTHLKIRSCMASCRVLWIILSQEQVRMEDGNIISNWWRETQI